MTSQEQDVFGLHTGHAREAASKAVADLLQIIHKGENERSQVAKTNEELPARFELFQGFVEELVSAGRSDDETLKLDLSPEQAMQFYAFNDRYKDQFVLSSLVQVGETHDGMAFDYLAAGYAYGVNGVRVNHTFFLINGVPLRDDRDVPEDTPHFGKRFNDDREVYGKIVATYPVTAPAAINRYEDLRYTLDEADSRFAQAAPIATQITEALQDVDVHGDITVDQWRPHIFEVTFNADGTQTIAPDSSLHQAQNAYSVE